MHLRDIEWDKSGSSERPYESENEDSSSNIHKTSMDPRGTSPSVTVSVHAAIRSYLKSALADLLAAENAQLPATDALNVENKQEGDRNCMKKTDTDSCGIAHKEDICPSGNSRMDAGDTSGDQSSNLQNHAVQSGDVPSAGPAVEDSFSFASKSRGGSTLTPTAKYTEWKDIIFP